MSDDAAFDELDQHLQRIAELFPKLRAPIGECDEKWAEMVETLVLEDLLGQKRLLRLRGHMAATRLGYGTEWHDLIERLRKA
jgi:hypothetical protein